jgi:hypothetical protein
MPFGLCSAPATFVREASLTTHVSCTRTMWLWLAACSKSTCSTCRTCSSRDPAALQTKQLRHTAHSGIGTDWTAIIMERHRRLQPHVRKLLCLVEIPRRVVRHTRALLRIRRHTISARIVLPRSKVKDVLTDLHGALSGSHLGVNKTLNKAR